MSASQSANEKLIVSRYSARDAIGSALRLFVGKGRRYSVKQLSNATGVPDRSIEAAMCDPDDPESRQLSNENLLSIAKFLRAPFAVEWMRLAGLGAFDLPDCDMPTPGELVAEIANDTAEIAEAARDGKFGPVDRPTLKAVGLRSIERGMQLAAGEK